VDRDALGAAVSAHLHWFDSDVLLLKSPFNATRVAAMREAIGGPWVVVYKTRELSAVAESIERAGSNTSWKVDF
jgi:hypothetical protein